MPIDVDDQEGASSRDNVAYAAAFNPFGSVGTAVEQPAIEAPAPTGDWALPLVAALVGLICIAALIRKILD